MVKRTILLNPGPATTSDTVKQALVVPDICPREKEFGQLIDTIRNDLVAIAHGQDRYIAVLFAASGTGGDEAAITSAVPLGKKLLVVENGAYGTRMVDIAKTYHIDVVPYTIPYNAYPDVDAIERIISADPDITHLAVAHHETTSGMLNPVPEIITAAHRYGVEVIVDAMSSFPVISTDINALGADYLVSSSNKCLHGMAGLTFVLVSRKAFERLEPRRRSFYFDIYSQHTGFDNTFQMPFTPPVQIIYAFKQAIDEYFQETEQGRKKRYAENWNLLYHGMKTLGFKPLLPYEQESGILISFLEPESAAYSFSGMHDYLYAGGFTIYPGKIGGFDCFRLAVIGDLYPDDIQAFLARMADYLKENDIRP